MAGLWVSLVMMAAKVAYSNRDAIKDLIFETELTTVNITQNGEVMLRYIWVESIRYSSVWLPILCGLLTTYFTGLMVFLDSDVPGVHPPSPFSPAKYRRQSGHTFHSNYAFALFIGATVTAYMYWCQMAA